MSKVTLEKGRTILGEWYVRPLEWAGIWRKDKETDEALLVSGNVLYKSKTEKECDDYIEKYHLSGME